MVNENHFVSCLRPFWRARGQFIITVNFSNTSSDLVHTQCSKSSFMYTSSLLEKYFMLHSDSLESEK